VLETGATVHAPSFVGAGAILRAGATVGPLASIGHGAVVGAGSSVERAVLQAGARVGEGCELRDVVIGPDYELPDGAAPLAGSLHGHP
jgi:NDP-sugar pyrophosphorylase family protein